MRQRLDEVPNGAVFRFDFNQADTCRKVWFPETGPDAPPPAAPGRNYFVNETTGRLGWIDTPEVTVLAIPT